MSVPDLLIELLKNSPIGGGLGLLGYFGYKTVAKVMDSTVSIAVIPSVIGTQQSCERAPRAIEALQRQSDDPPGPAAPPGRRERPRRQRTDGR